MNNREKLVHIALDLNTLRKKLVSLRKKGASQNILETPDGRVLSFKEAFLKIDEYSAKGYTHLPSCNNVDVTGQCKGHYS